MNLDPVNPLLIISLILILFLIVTCHWIYECKHETIKAIILYFSTILATAGSFLLILAFG